MNRRRHRDRKRPKNKRSHKISDHFSKKDFTDKSATEDQKKLKISLGLIGGLELLRSLAGQRINIIKGYENPDNVDNPKSYRKNYHTMGLAARITIDNTDVQTAFLLAEKIPEFRVIGIFEDDNTLYVDSRKEEERSLFIEKEGERNEITEENRHELITATLPDDA